jgi:hypothetical protein
MIKKHWPIMIQISHNNGSILTKEMGNKLKKLGVGSIMSKVCHWIHNYGKDHNF